MNTLKQLVLQEADTQKILLNIQTFMECALEVRAEAWQSVELPYIPALLHIFPGVSKPPRTRLFVCCSGGGIALAKLCFVSCAEEQVPVSGWGEGNYCFGHRSLCDDKMAQDNVFLGHLCVILSLSVFLSALSVLTQEASVKLCYTSASCWGQDTGSGHFYPTKATTRSITIPEYMTDLI